MPDARPLALRDELRATLRLALPLAGANLLQMAVYAVDVVFVARLGQEALAASALGVALAGLLMWAMTGLVGAAAPLIAAALGRRRHALREVRRSVRMGLWLAVASGMVAMAVCWLAEPIMLASGQPPALAARSAGFIAVLMWSMVPMVVAGHLRNVVATLGKPGAATAVAALALAVNAAGNYLLVFGAMGAPALGLRGSALASVITSVAMVVAYVAVIRFDRRLCRYRLFGRWWRADLPRLAELTRIGLPITAMILAEAGLFSGAAFLMGRIGEAELAGHSMALQFAALAFQVPYGIGQAATIRVGIAYGAGDPAAVGRAGAVAIVLGVAFMSMTALLMWAFPRAILRLYLDPEAPANAAMVAFALEYMVLAAAFQLFDGAQAVTAGSLRGLQDTRVPMLIALFGYWVPGLATALWLGFLTPLRGTGVWIGLAVSLVVVAVLLLWRWRARERLGLVPMRLTAGRGGAPQQLLLPNA